MALSHLDYTDKRSILTGFIHTPLQIEGYQRPQPRPPDVDELVSSAQLPYLLSQSDFAVVAVPFTSQTLGLFGEVQLRMMKRTAYLVDVSGRPTREGRQS